MQWSENHQQQRDAYGASETAHDLFRILFLLSNSNSFAN